jgi:hypothetical protein
MPPPTKSPPSALVEETTRRCLDEIARAVEAEPRTEEKIITALLVGHYVYTTILSTAADAEPEMRQAIFRHATRAIRQSLGLDLERVR